MYTNHDLQVILLAGRKDLVFGNTFECPDKWQLVATKLTEVCRNHKLSRSQAARAARNGTLVAWQFEREWWTTDWDVRMWKREAQIATLPEQKTTVEGRIRAKKKNRATENLKQTLSFVR